MSAHEEEDSVVFDDEIDKNAVLEFNEDEEVVENLPEEQLQSANQSLEQELEEEECENPSTLEDDDPIMRAIQIIRSHSYQDNPSDMAFILEELEKFDHFQQIKEEEGYEDLLKQSLDYLHYDHVPKGKFLFHFGDIGEKFYFIAKGKVSIHVPRAAKEIFKQEKSYQLRKHWGDQIDLQTLSANERETAKLHYQRARQKILKCQEKYQHEKFYKKLINGHPSNQKCFHKYFHKQYKTFGLYKQVNELREGQSFGEVATISRKLRTASVFAEEDLHLFYLRGSDYLTIFQNQLYKLNFILKNLEKYLENLSKKQILDLSYLFEPFECTLNLNQIIFKEGSERQYIYLIRSGSVAFKSSRGISLGIIGEGEFFGFENKKGTDRCLLTEAQSFSAICIGNGTQVYRLKIQLLEEEEFIPALKEFALKGFVKAEYYFKRAKHCQNIFEQNEANNPYNQELQNYSEFAQQKSPFSNESPLVKAKNLRKLMTKIQIQRKFNQYLEENFNRQQQQAQQQQMQSGTLSQENILDQQKSGRPSQIGSFGSNPQIQDYGSDNKGSQVSISDNIVQSMQYPSAKQQIQNSGHISNKINENEVEIRSFLTADQINSFNYHTQFKKPDSAQQRSSVQQLHSTNTPDIGDGQHFQFISKSEFEQTKNHIIKEQEKLRARKAQHYVPQEIADMPLSRKLTQKFCSSSSLLTLTPQSNTGNRPLPPHSSFFNLQQPSSPLKSSTASHSPNKMPASPLKIVNNKPPIIESLASSDNHFFPSSSAAVNSDQQVSTQPTINTPNSNSIQLTTSIILKKQVQKSPFNKRMSVDSLAQNTYANSFDEKKNLLFQKKSVIQSRRGSKGSLIISSLQIPSKSSEKRNTSTSKQRLSPGEEQLGSLLMSSRQPSYTQLSSSPLQLKKRISAFSYSQTHSNFNLNLKPTPIQNSSDKIIQNPNSTSTGACPIIVAPLTYSAQLNNNQNLDQFLPDIATNTNENLLNTNYFPQQSTAAQQNQINEEAHMLSPLFMRPKKSFLSVSNSNNEQSNFMNETLKKFNQTHNQISDKKMMMNLAVTDLNFPQNNKPSLTTITLRSFTDLNQVTSKPSTSQIQNQQSSPILNPLNQGHRRSISQIQQQSPSSDYQFGYKSAPKNKQYSQLFKKNNESKSLKKKQKIKPLLMNETDAVLSSNGFQQMAPSSPYTQPLCIQASRSSATSFFNPPKSTQNTQRKKVNSFVTQSNSQMNSQYSGLNSPIIKQERMGQTSQQFMQNKVSPKLSLNGVQQSPPFHYHSPLPSSARTSLQIQQQQFCSLKQFFEQSDNINHMKYEIILNNQPQPFI